MTDKVCMVIIIYRLPLSCVLHGTSPSENSPGGPVIFPFGYRQEMLFDPLSESLKNTKYSFAVKKKGKAVG